MPSTKPITDYPYAQFGALLARVGTTKEAAHIPSAAKLQANSLRGLLYAFRRACLRDRAHAAALGIDVDAIVSVNMRMEGSVLILEHKEKTPMAQALGEMMAELGIDPIVSPQEAMLERLKGIAPEADGGEHG